MQFCSEENFYGRLKLSLKCCGNFNFEQISFEFLCFSVAERTKTSGILLKVKFTA